MKTRFEGAIPLAIFLLLFVAFLSSTILHGSLNAPPEPEVSDGVEYDSIAWQLAKGNGFSLDYDDAAFRKPYQDRPEQSYVLQRTGKGSTTYRPPLLPVVMSGFYNAFGRTFVPIRIFNIIAVAAATALLFTLVRRISQTPTATATAFFIVLDSRTWFFSNKILTEGLAFLATVATLCCLVKFSEHRNRKWAVITAVAVACAFFTRSIVIFWFPVIAVVLAILCNDRTSLLTAKQSFKLVALYLLTFLLLTTPWFIRNSLVMDGFAPLGSMGAMSMAAAYSDEAVQVKGRWFSLADRGFFTSEESDRFDTLRKERRDSRQSQAKAIQWIKDNPGKVPILMGYKALTTWEPETPRQTLLLACAFLGCLFFTQKKHLVILVGLIFANTLAVSITWSVGNRFLFPILPVLAVLAGSGLTGLYNWGLSVAARWKPLPGAGEG